jgi:hypothetical protein
LSVDYGKAVSRFSEEVIPVATHPLAGQLAPADELIDVIALQNAYYERRPDLEDPRQRVVFGTSGHRGTSLDNSFTSRPNSPVTRAHLKDPLAGTRVQAGVSVPLSRNSAHKSEVLRESFATQNPRRIGGYGRIAELLTLAIHGS